MTRNPATDNSAPTIKQLLFHEAMDSVSFASALGKCFNDIAGLSPRDIADMKRSWEQIPIAGQPIRPEKIALFEYIEAQHENGETVESTLQTAIGRGFAPIPRRRRGSDPLQDVEKSLLREYWRYKRKKNAGLDPAIAYGSNALFDSILAKQWDTAAAIFANANKVRRIKVCDTLNRILQNRDAR